MADKVSFWDDKRVDHDCTLGELAVGFISKVERRGYVVEYAAQNGDRD